MRKGGHKTKQVDGKAIVLFFLKGRKNGNVLSKLQKRLLLIEKLKVLFHIVKPLNAGITTKRKSFPQLVYFVVILLLYKPTTPVSFST